MRELARNPLILGTLAGLLFNLSGAQLPLVAGQFLARLSEASIALGLLTVGGGAAGARRIGGAFPLGLPAVGREAARSAGHRLGRHMRSACKGFTSTWWSCSAHCPPPVRPTFWP
ncbi:MAG: hypothetical protein M5R42_00480 [Rhodocyclaceae bacterium]|nr:hypothetical protein [Rhodocyclaceae bacterium]